MEKFNSYDSSSFDVSFLRHFQTEKINYSLLTGKVLKAEAMFHVKQSRDLSELFGLFDADLVYLESIVN